MASGSTSGRADLPEVPGRGSTAPGPISPTSRLDQSLRPGSGISSGKRVTDQLAVFIRLPAAGEPLDHVLLAGPPVGKTSLANIVAAEMGVPLIRPPARPWNARVTSPPFRFARAGSVFFIGKIHRLGRAVEETLYPAMEDGELPVVLGQGRCPDRDPAVAAFTDRGPPWLTLTTPLPAGPDWASPHRLGGTAGRRSGREDRGSFGQGSSGPRSTRGGGERSPSVPAARRVANRLLKRVRDLRAEVQGSGSVDAGNGRACWEMLRSRHGRPRRRGRPRPMLELIADASSGPGRSACRRSLVASR